MKDLSLQPNVNDLPLARLKAMVIQLDCSDTINENTVNLNLVQNQRLLTCPPENSPLEM
jgi:hypothetical protein